MRNETTILCLVMIIIGASIGIVSCNKPEAPKVYLNTKENTKVESEVGDTIDYDDMRKKLDAVAESIREVEKAEQELYNGVGDKLRNEMKKRMEIYQEASNP